MATQNDLEQALQKNKLLSQCKPDELLFSLVEYTSGSRVSTTYNGEASIGLVVSGRVNVYSVGVDGFRICLTTHNAGDCFGVAAIFTGEGPNTVLECSGKTVVAYLSHSNFINMLDSHPYLLKAYSLLLNQKIAFLTEKIEFLTMPSCRARLASYLLKNEVSNALDLAISKEQLAQIIGVSRASLFRELSRMSHEGLISIKGKHIDLLNKEKLTHIIQ